MLVAESLEHFCFARQDIKEAGEKLSTMKTLSDTIIFLTSMLNSQSAQITKEIFFSLQDVLWSSAVL